MIQFMFLSRMFGEACGEASTSPEVSRCEYSRYDTDSISTKPNSQESDLVANAPRAFSAIARFARA